MGLWCPPLVEPASAPTERLIAEKYADLATSGLIVEVTVNGPNVFTFGLTSE